MKTKTTTIRARIAVRAYYAWQNGSTGSADANWLEAEAVEVAYAERRAASAAKAAATRRANAGKAPVEVLVATTGRPSIRRATAH